LIKPLLVIITIGYLLSDIRYASRS
jgi:hypothetical protein